MKADLKEVIASVFEPFVFAAGREDLLAVLKTEDLPKNEKSVQFGQFKTIKLHGTNVAHLPGGGFLCLYEHVNGRYLAFSLPRLNEADDTTVSKWGDNLGFNQKNLDQSTFMFLCHELKGFYSIKSQFRRKEESLNVIDVVDDYYTGHSFRDLYEFYEQVYIFEIPHDNSLYGEAISAYGFDLCSNFSGARAANITKKMNDVLWQLGRYSSISKDSLFQCLTATQSRHSFIELYRCLESIYYFPWILELRDAGSLNVPIAALKAHCRASLNWREREEPSIMKIFGLVNPDEETKKIEKSIKIFKKHTKNKTFKRDSIGREIYQLRNSLVHHENYEKPERVIISSREWEDISLYLSKILLKFTSDHAHEFA